ncbi:unnamed protein product [Litomosoides sigmodontis]|uniref:Uncharacterized protein n=1 Tax=Litomosoides sigmodontis TaxID=42156 RepID=A0A3P6TJM5_LITSI|nr:unnamed protein product [Litomosoides sigmodontis]
MDIFFLSSLIQFSPNVDSVWPLKNDRILGHFGSNKLSLRKFQICVDVEFIVGKKFAYGCKTRKLSDCAFSFAYNCAYMRCFGIPAELIAMISIILVRENSSTSEMAKHPYRIHVMGEVMCRNKGAYAVLINIFEEVKYIRYGSVVKGHLRTSDYVLSEYSGRFVLKGTRHSIDDKIYLNITHHCIYSEKRNIHQNCFMQVKHEITDDSRRVRYELRVINLEAVQYQRGEVKCVNWPYKYPEFNKTIHSDL